MCRSCWRHQPSRTSGTAAFRCSSSPIRGWTRRPVAVVLVTGCSSGFGDLIARTLASSGHSVFATMRDVAGRNAAPAEALRSFAQAGGHTLEVLEMDVTGDASVASGVAQVLQRVGTID